MVLIEQIEALLHYLENNPELALGHLYHCKEGRSLSKKHWENCETILNGVTPNCPKKSANEWRTYYNEFKFKTLKKRRAQKAEMSSTGGRIAMKNVLTPTQERLLNLLERNVEDALQNVRHNPLSPAAEDPPAAAHPPVTRRGPIRRPMKRTRAQMKSKFTTPTSQGRLKRIRYSNAVLLKARAINRLASAFERIADKLNEPFVIVVKEEQSTPMPQPHPPPPHDNKKLFF